ncbi:hypothetical protein [Actinokineospora enzanensis]|uniref:hypothetical protein n=1 Tax=Actinokineospora enzanensis TaxID=155975 RepID=UPI00037FDEC8|nr:hypothetical protein [Actinokineospora enzanensis]
MTENEMTALRDVADDAVLFHRGWLGGPEGFRWAADGAPAGYVPQWECEALARLVRRGYIVIESALGVHDAVVRVSAAGADLIDLPIAA